VGGGGGGGCGQVHLIYIIICNIQYQLGQGTPCIHRFSINLLVRYVLNILGFESSSFVNKCFSRIAVATTLASFMILSLSSITMLLYVCALICVVFRIVSKHYSNFRLRIFHCDYNSILSYFQIWFSFAPKLTDRTMTRSPPKM